MDNFNVAKIEKDNEQGILKETINHADEVIKSKVEETIITPDIAGVQSINLDKASLFDVDKNIIPRISSYKSKKLSDTMFDLLLDYNNQEEGQSRKLEKKAGSVMTSILVTSITITLGIIAAVIFLK